MAHSIESTTPRPVIGGQCSTRKLGWQFFACLNESEPKSSFLGIQVAEKSKLWYSSLRPRYMVDTVVIE